MAVCSVHDGPVSARDVMEERGMSTPIGPYSPVVRAGPWLICSGQLGLGPTPHRADHA